MQKRKVGGNNQALNRRSQFKILTRVLGGIMLFLTLLYNPVRVFSAPMPGGYNAALMWESSPSPDVVGNRVYYGVLSGVYLNSVVAENSTGHTVQGLVGGVPYFFAVTSYDSNGLESDFSEEIRFVPGEPTVGVRVASNGQPVLTVKGLIGQTYNIEATEDLTNWTVIGTVILGVSGSAEFTDTDAANFPKRFYRTRNILL